MAAILSIVETCRAAYPPTRDYLQAVLPDLADFAIARVAGLTPRAWATARTFHYLLAWVGWLKRIRRIRNFNISTWNPLPRLAKISATKEIPCKEAYPSCHFP